MQVRYPLSSLTFQHHCHSHHHFLLRGVQPGVLVQMAKGLAQKQGLGFPLNESCNGSRPHTTCWGQYPGGHMGPCSTSSTSEASLQPSLALYLQLSHWLPSSYLVNLNGCGRQQWEQLEMKSADFVSRVQGRIGLGPKQTHSGHRETQ